MDCRSEFNLRHTHDVEMRLREAEEMVLQLKNNGCLPRGPSFPTTTVGSQTSITISHVMWNSLCVL